MSLLLLFGNHPWQGAAAGQSTVAGNFPGRLQLAMGATGVATTSASLGVGIRFKQSATNTAGTTASTLNVTLGSALAVGDLVVVGYAANYGPNSVTATGVTFSKPASANFYYGKVTSAGATTVTVNWTAGTNMNVHVMVFANADVALDDAWSWTGNNVTNTPNVGSGSYNFGNTRAPVLGGNLVVAIAQWNTSAAVSSTGGGFTSTSADIGATTSLRSVAAYQIFGSTTLAPAASWTLSATTTWTAGALVIVPTQSAVPPAPTNVRIYHTNSGLVLSWDPVAGATAGYKIYESGTLQTSVNGGNTTGASMFVTTSTGGLTPGSLKSYTVRAVNSFGESADSAAVSFIPAATPAWTVRNKYPATNPPSAASTTQQITNTSTAGQAYAVSVLLPDATTSVTSVTGGGVTWQRAGRITSGALGLELWYAMNLPGGSDTITVTVSASVLFNIDLVAVSNVAEAEAFGTTSGGSGSTSFLVPCGGATTDGAFYIALVGEADISASNQAINGQTLPFSDNAMTNGSSVSSKTYFVQGLGAGTDSRMGSGLSITHSPVTSWGAVYMVFNRQKIQLGSAPAGGGSGAGSLNVAHSGVSLASSLAGAATTAAAARVVRGVASSSTGVGAVTGATRVTRRLVGSGAGVATTSGAAKVRYALAGASAGVATDVGAVAVRRALLGSAAGAAALSTALALIRGVTGSAVGSATGGASVSISGFHATLDGEATVAGASAVSHTLGGALAGTATTTGASAVTHTLAGQPAGDAGCAASTSVLRALAGSSSATGAVSGAVRVQYRLHGAPAGGASGAGTLTRLQLMAGSGAGDGSAIATVANAKALSAATAGHGQASVTLHRTVGLAGAVVGATHTLAGVAALRTIVGSASGQGVVHALPRVVHTLESDASSASTAAASLTPVRGLRSTIHGDATAAMAVALRLVLAAQAHSSSMVDSTLVLLLGLAALSAGTSSMSPRVRLGGHPPRPILMRLSAVEYRSLALR